MQLIMPNILVQAALAGQGDLILFHAGWCLQIFWATRKLVTLLGKAGKDRNGGHNRKVFMRYYPGQ